MPKSLQIRLWALPGAEFSTCTALLALAKLLLASSFLLLFPQFPYGYLPGCAHYYTSGLEQKRSGHIEKWDGRESSFLEGDPTETCVISLSVYIQPLLYSRKHDLNPEFSYGLKKFPRMGKTKEEIAISFLSLSPEIDVREVRAARGTIFALTRDRLYPHCDVFCKIHMACHLVHVPQYADKDWWNHKTLDHFSERT